MLSLVKRLKGLFLYGVIVFGLLAPSLSFAEDYYSLPLKEIVERAKAGDPEAQFIIGMHLSVEDMPEEAAKWYRRAAEQGNLGAQQQLGKFYEQGRGVPKSNEKAVQWYTAAAEQGNQAAKDALAKMYKEGRGVKKNPAIASRLEKESEKYRSDLAWLENKREKERQEAQDLEELLLGMKLATGDGVPQDLPKALEIIKKLAEKGNPDAQYLLGHSYLKGEGIDLNYQKADEWLRKSALQGHEDAQLRLAMMYFNGTGVDRNYREAAKWHIEAASKGNQFSMYSLGYLYSSGLGVPQDFHKGNEWYGQAIKNNIDTSITEAARDQIGLNNISLKMKKVDRSFTAQQRNFEAIAELLEKPAPTKETSIPSTPKQVRCSTQYGITKCSTW